MRELCDWKMARSRSAKLKVNLKRETLPQKEADSQERKKCCMSDGRKATEEEKGKIPVNPYKTKGSEARWEQDNCPTRICFFLNKEVKKKVLRLNNVAVVDG